MEVFRTPWPTVGCREGHRAAVVDGLVVVFFLDRERCSDPGPIIKAFSRFVGGVGHGLLRFFADEDGNPRRLPARLEPFIQREMTRMANSGEHAKLTLFDREHGGIRSEAEYLHNPDVDLERWPDKKNVLWFRVGPERLREDGLERVENFARSLCDVLPYASGYVSPALSLGEVSRQLHRFVCRYLGFDIARPSSVASDIGDRPPGAYWLNFFGPRLVCSLGGRDTLRANLPAAIQISPCGGGGTVLKLGDRPDVGDVNRGQDLPLQRALAVVLEPLLRVPQVTYLQDGEGMPDPEFQREWHLRFLGPVGPHG